MTREQFVSNVKETRDALRHFLVALCCGDSALADDIAQEAYLKAYLWSDRLDDEPKFQAWLFKISYNTFIDHRRASKVSVGYEETLGMPSSDKADDSFRYQELYAALNQLPPKERMSVLLYYMEGYSIKEIAAIESVSADAVKQHLSRGRNRLRQLLTSDI